MSFDIRLLVTQSYRRMWRTGLIFTALGAISLAGLRAAPAPEIVVAIRYLQPKGTSHAHLYLYREDGKLLRQLTNDNSGQDLGPIFSPDGTTIVFRRDKPNDVREFWSIEPLGANLKKLEAAPDWYTGLKDSPYFTNRGERPGFPIAPLAADAPRNFKAQDGSVEIVLREDPKDPDDEINFVGHGKHYLLRDLKSGKQTEFGKLPGFYGAFDVLYRSEGDAPRFLFDGTLRVAFIGLHLNSTDGNTVFALDLTQPRLVRLSPNWAVPFPLSGEAAFLTDTENRYVPIPGTRKTANCSYVERWDAKLNRIRYAREGTAAVTYGASMYRPGLVPAVITIRGPAD
jgi:hypothetical protein